ncbi:hypothetical protein D1B33_01225 [Lysinibacillus yapensis]|uniref:DnaA N-terminal domain-containing protein n=1 Tax=Ureibacillus yapensis TaxID=2304605 RepID=A0A396SDX6_9BACL|nr:DnaA N-terminal domain-containing protein [Lysinibacillus yapensis]RHW39495.1 hypothetical protein D1B33_01225 [Lysinibacillus yapensis]
MDQWSQVLQRIEKQISKASFETWLKATSGELTDDNTVVVIAPNSFAADWLQKYYTELITESIELVTGQSYPVTIKGTNQTRSSNSSTTHLSEDYDTNQYKELKELVQQQSELIQKQQRKIEELEKRLTLLESRRIV